MDKNKNLFRQKVSFMCTTKAIPTKNNKKERKNSTKSANIERLPPSIPAKSLKEVKVIFKYFKVLNIPQAKKNQKKYMPRPLNPSTILRKFSRLRTSSYLSRKRKSRIFKKSSIVAVSLNCIFT